MVEPSLTVSKSLALTGPGDASDQVDYTITIANTAASSTTAFDVQLTDVLPAQIDWATASIVSVSGTAAANFTYDPVTGSVKTSGNDAIDLARGAPNIVVVVRGFLLPNVPSNQSVSNQATVRWSSLDNSVAGTPVTDRSVHTATGDGERTGDTSNPGGALNDYTATSAAATFTVPQGQHQQDADRHGDRQCHEHQHPGGDRRAGDLSDRRHGARGRHNRGA